MLSESCGCTETARCTAYTHVVTPTKMQKSRYEIFMKRFNEKHAKLNRCRHEQVAASKSTFTRKEFPTGSVYKGHYEDMNMRGYGEYTFPNGVLYRGEFESNMCHGNGELIYDYGSEEYTAVRGKWVKGVMTESKVFFCGVLEYNKDDWQYCKMPDRRYAVEFNKELKPAGQSNITAEQPPREIPRGFYDTGYGFYNPRTKVVYKYHNILEVLKAVAIREQNWIEDHCRLEPMGQVGPRPDFYEPWLEPNLNPLPLPKLLVGFKPNQSPSNIDEDEAAVDAANAAKPVFYDSSTPFQSVPPRKFKPAKK